MNYFPELDATYWKQTNDQEKFEIFEAKILPKISENLKITQLQLKTFEMSGIKIRSFQFQLNNEPFTFIPAAKNVILGWDNGSDDDILREVLLNSYDDLVDSVEQQRMNSKENFNEWINRHTTNLRKVDIPPMIVAKYALPASTAFFGTINPITGTFKGDYSSYKVHENAIKKVLFPNLSFAESLNFVQPENYLEPTHFYIEQFIFKEQCRVYHHQPMNLKANLDAIKQFGFRLLSEDEWEFVVGGGTRKLFRFNTQEEVAALIEKGDSYQKIKVTEAENMFGLVIDSSRTRFELTNDALVLKLKKQAHKENIVKDVMTLATYYQSHQTIDFTDILSPEVFQLRKMIDLSE